MSLNPRRQNQQKYAERGYRNGSRTEKAFLVSLPHSYDIMI
ncbi:hypothetical protein [Bacillus velezensis]|nr:hypothetical protein [Bacillus velezensis]